MYARRANRCLTHGNRFLYTQFLSLDACFRVKRYDVSDETKDPIIDEGLAYFIPDKPYKELVKKYKAQAPVSTIKLRAAPPFTQWLVTSI